MIHNRTCLPSVADFIKRERLFVPILTRFGKDLLVLVAPNQVDVSKLFEVTVVFPELKIVAFGLVSSNFIKDAQIERAILWAELF